MSHHCTEVSIALTRKSACSLVQMRKTIGLSVPANQIPLSSGEGWLSKGNGEDSEYCQEIHV